MRSSCSVPTICANRNARPEEEVTAAQMIAGLQQMALRAEAGGIQLLGATLTPFGNETFLPGAWNPTREGHRVALNTWIRESGAFDGVVDFDEALRDPARPTEMLPSYDCDDGLHPSDLGYCRNGRRDRPGAVRLDIAHTMTTSCLT